MANEVENLELLDIFLDDGFRQSMEGNVANMPAIGDAEYRESCSRLLEILTDSSLGVHATPAQQQADRALRQQIMGHSAPWTASPSVQHPLFISRETYNCIRKLVKKTSFTFRWFAIFPNRPLMYSDIHPERQWNILHRLMKHPIIGALFMFIELWMLIDRKQGTYGEAFHILARWDKEIRDTATRMVHHLMCIQFAEGIWQGESSCVWVHSNRAIVSQQQFALIQDALFQYDLLQQLAVNEESGYYGQDPMLPANFHNQIFRV